MRCVFPALILGALLHAPTSLAAVSRRAFSNSGSSPAPSTLDFSGQPAQNVTLPNGQHPLTNDSPSLNLWTPAERAAFDKSVANFPDPVKTSACANYNTQSIVVYVYYRIHYYSNKGSKLRQHGYISEAQVRANLAQLNKDYAKNVPKMRFVLGSGTSKSNAGIYYTVFDKIAAWNAFVVAPPANDAQLKIVNDIATNARGSVSSRPSNQYRQLFVYTVKALTSNTIAFAFLPGGPQSFPYDGIYFSQEYFEKPKSDVNYHYPHTIAHEVGHWFSLQHTFEGGCSAPNTLNGGDYVTDTPRWAQSNNFYSNACPAYTSYGYNYADIEPPCPGLSKADTQKNIANFMSYSLALCPNSFTPGQMQRAWSAAINFRKFVPSCGASA